MAKGRFKNRPNIPRSSVFDRIENGSRSRSRKEKERISGFIFMCSGKTKPDCYKYHVFGLPAGNRDVVEKIKPGTKLFLFDIDLKLLYGVYKATSGGKMDLEPDAFRRKFPAQVRFKVDKDCLPLPESSFKHAILDNYQRGSRFSPELTSRQVRSLQSLFRPFAASPRGHVSHSRELLHPDEDERYESSMHTSRAHETRSLVLEDQYQPIRRLPPLDDPYAAEMYRGHTPPFLEPQYGSSRGLPPRHERYEYAEVDDVYSPRDGSGFPLHNDPYYYAEAQRQQLRDHPVPRVRDPHYRYVAMHDDILPDRYMDSEYDQFSLQRRRGREILLQRESDVEYRPRRGIPAHALEHSPPVRPDLAPRGNVPISSYYSFAGSNPLYR